MKRPHCLLRLKGFCSNHIPAHNLKIHTSLLHIKHLLLLLTNTLNTLAWVTRLQVGLSAPDSQHWCILFLFIYFCFVLITSWSCSLQSSSPQQHSSSTGDPHRHLCLSLELHSGPCSSSVSSMCICAQGSKSTHKRESCGGWGLST